MSSDKVRIAELNALLDKVEEQNNALADALHMMMKWIGPPPVDRESFDSAREDAWKASKSALRASGRFP